MKLHLAVAALLLAAIPASFAQKANPNPDEQAIRRLDREWSAAAGARDVEKAISYYADDGSALPFNGPIATGKEQIRQVWTHLVSLPGFGLSFGPTRIDVAKSGDIAYEVGTFELKVNDAQGNPTTQIGKYVVAWKKYGKQWKVVADIFNTDK